MEKSLCVAEGVHPKSSLLISVGEDTDRGSAVGGDLTEYLLLRQFGKLLFRIPFR
jgi:hypothetical protein